MSGRRRHGWAKAHPLGLRIAIGRVAEAVEADEHHRPVEVSEQRTTLATLSKLRGTDKVTLVAGRSELAAQRFVRRLDCWSPVGGSPVGACEFAPVSRSEGSPPPSERSRLVGVQPAHVHDRHAALADGQATVSRLTASTTRYDAASGPSRRFQRCGVRIAAMTTTPCRSRRSRTRSPRADFSSG